MRRRLGSYDPGWIPRALAVIAVCCATAIAGGDDAENASRGPAVQEPQAPARPPRGAILQLMQRQGAPDFKVILEEKRQSFRPLLISEIQFCRRAAGLTKQQALRIALKAGTIVEQTVSEAASLQVKTAQRDCKPFGPDPVKAVRSILEKLVGECATTVQHQQYLAEVKKRDAHRRETAIHALVARLDRTLMLSSSQREQLLRLFESSWDEEWGVLDGLLGDDEAPLPAAFPTRPIIPLLNWSQVIALKRLEFQAIDAGEAYMAVVAEILVGLPSEFNPALESAARQADESPAPSQKKVSSK